MKISDLEIRACIHHANFPLAKREYAFKVIHAGLESYREHRVRRYYGSSGKAIKKPTKAHRTMDGRYSQSGARFVLIASLYRAWTRGFGINPTLNNKYQLDSAFFHFAQEVMAREGIGRIHQHLEEYWSYVKKTLKDADSEL